MPIDACGPNYHAYLKGLSYITALTNTLSLMKNMQTQTNRRKKSPLTVLCFLMKHILGLGLLNVQNTFRSSWCTGIEFPTWLSPTAETSYLKKKILTGISVASSKGNISGSMECNLHWTAACEWKTTGVAHTSLFISTWDTLFPNLVIEFEHDWETYFIMIGREQPKYCNLFFSLCIAV